MELFGVGPGEILLILVIALVVLGPERLPEVARQMGHLAAELQRLAGQVTVELQQCLEAEAQQRTPPRSDASGAPARRYCAKCGAPGAPEARYCMACGAPLELPHPVEESQA
jgi:Tat protein translocase TatB subunit